MALVLQGMTSKQIGRELGLSDKTVDTYVKRVMKAYGETDRRSAARRAIADAARTSAGADHVRPAADDAPMPDTLGSPSGSPPVDLPYPSPVPPSTAPEVREFRAAYHVEPRGWRWWVALFLDPPERKERRINDLRPAERAALIFGGAMVFTVVFAILTIALLVFGTIGRWILRP